jgi:hypothetical protein
MFCISQQASTVHLCIDIRKMDDTSYIAYGLKLDQHHKNIVGLEKISSTYISKKNDATEYSKNDTGLRQKLVRVNLMYTLVHPLIVFQVHAVSIHVSNCHQECTQSRMYTKWNAAYICVK